MPDMDLEADFQQKFGTPAAQQPQDLNADFQQRFAGGEPAVSPFAQFTGGRMKQGIETAPIQADSGDEQLQGYAKTEAKRFVNGALVFNPQMTKAQQTDAQSAFADELQGHLQAELLKKHVENETNYLQSGYFGRRGTLADVIKTIPGARTGYRIGEAYELKKAVEDYQANKATPDQYQLLAGHLARNQYDAGAGFMQKVSDISRELPAEVAEWMMLAGPAGKAGEAGAKGAAELGGSALTQWAAKQVAAASLRTVLRPDKLAEQTLSRMTPSLTQNQEGGLQTKPGEALPSAVGKAVEEQLLNNLAFEATGTFKGKAGFSALGIGGSTVKALAATQFQPEVSAHLGGAGGPGGVVTQLFNAKDGEERSKILKDFAAQGLVFGTLETLMHGFGKGAEPQTPSEPGAAPEPGGPEPTAPSGEPGSAPEPGAAQQAKAPPVPEVYQKLSDYVAWLKKQGYSKKEIIERVNNHAQDFARTNPANEGATRAKMTEWANRPTVSDGPEREFLRAMANLHPEEAEPKAGPTPQEQPQPAQPPPQPPAAPPGSQTRTEGPTQLQVSGEGINQPAEAMPPQLGVKPPEPPTAPPGPSEPPEGPKPVSPVTTPPGASQEPPETDAQYETRLAKEKLIATSHAGAPYAIEKSITDSGAESYSEYEKSQRKIGLKGKSYQPRTKEELAYAKAIFAQREAESETRPSSFEDFTMPELRDHARNNSVDYRDLNKAALIDKFKQLGIKPPLNDVFPTQTPEFQDLHQRFLAGDQNVKFEDVVKAAKLPQIEANAILHLVDGKEANEIIEQPDMLKEDGSKYTTANISALVNKARRRLQMSKDRFDALLSQAMFDRASNPDIEGKPTLAVPHGELTDTQSQVQSNRDVNNQLNALQNRILKQIENGTYTKEQEATDAREITRLAQLTQGRSRQTKQKPLEWTIPESTTVGNKPPSVRRGPDNVVSESGETVEAAPESETATGSAEGARQSGGPPASAERSTPGGNELTGREPFLSGESGSFDPQAAIAGVIRTYHQIKDFLFKEAPDETAEVHAEAKRAGLAPAAAEKLIAEANRQAEDSARQEVAGSETPGGKSSTATEPDILYAGIPLTSALVEPVTKWLGAIGSSLRVTFNPASVSQFSQATAGNLRQRLSELANRDDVAGRALYAAKAFFDRAVVAEKDPARREANFLGFTDAYEGGQTANLPPQLQEFAATIKDLKDKVTAELVNRGLLQSFIDNHLGHLWKDPRNPNATPEELAARVAARSPLAGGQGFRKQRTMPTWRDGIDAGLEPATWNPIEAELSRLHEMYKSIFGRDVFNEEKDAGRFVYVSLGQRAPVVMVLVPDKFATQYAHIGGANLPTLVGHWYAPEESARLIDRFLSPGIRGNPIFDAAMGLSNEMNKLNLGWSAYHAVGTALNAQMNAMEFGLRQVLVGSLGQSIPNLIKGLIPLTATFHDLWQGNNLNREWYNPGSGGAEMADLLKSFEMAGGRAHMGSEYQFNAIEQFRTAIRQKAGLYSIIGAGLRAINEAVSWPIMSKLVPLTKMGAFANRAAAVLENLGPNATVDEKRAALYREWQSIENRMGQVTYDNLFWSRILRDAMHISIRSVGWNAGDIGEAGGAVADIPSSVKAAAKGKLISPRIAYLIAMPIVAGISGALIQYLMTGKGPDETKDLYFPKTGRIRDDGSEDRLSLPTYMKDFYSLSQKSEKGPWQWSENVYHAAMGKRAPLVTTGTEMLSNKDFFDKPIRNPDDPLVQQTQAEILHFLGGVQPLSTKAKEGATPGERGLSVLGLTPAPSYITRGPGGDAVNDFYDQLKRTQDLHRQATHAAQMGKPLPDYGPKEIGHYRRMEAFDHRMSELNKALLASRKDEDKVAIKALKVKVARNALGQ